MTRKLLVPLDAGSNKIVNLASGTASADAAAFGQVMTKLAATAAAGYTLVNGTGTIISWTAPSDSALHRVMLWAVCHVTSTATGGTCQFALTLPDAGTNTKSIFGTLSAANVYYPSSGTCPTSLIVGAGTTITISQSAALTGGAGVVWAELWGS